MSFYASSNVVAGGIIFPECSCVCSCMSPEQTLLARYLAYLLIEFDQTFTTKGLWDKDECVKFWGHRHSGGQISPKMHFLPH